MVKINSIGLLFFILLVFPACTDSFEEINTNPNNPTRVNPELLLAGIERDMMTMLVNETWEVGNLVVQHTAKNTSTNIDRYIWGERNQLWNAVYDNMREVNAILLQTTDEHESGYRAVALILRAWMFSLVTDCYGDVPYSEAMHGKNGILSPKYDSQELIYEGILQDLKEANQLLSNTNHLNIDNDFIYGGELKKWRKLANSLRLRYLLRLSGRKEVSVAMQEILVHPENNPIMESNEDNGSYAFLSTVPDQFPIVSLRIGSFNETRASKTLTDLLIKLQDPRLKIYYRATPKTEATSNITDDQFMGLPNGMNDVHAITYNGGPDFQSRISPLFYEQAVSDQGLQIAQGLIMTYAELQFVLAEAAERQFISGNAEGFYVNGIKASFDFYSIQDDHIYFLQEQVNYQGTHAEKIEKIITQKWISLFFQGFEAWFDYRRTGYPFLQAGVDNENANQIPVRFIYPIIEQSLNGNNRTEAIKRQGEDNINTHVWWDAQ